MMSTVGLELTNFLNPDLTWKTVAKGNRSATRRTRKHFVRNFTAGVELTDKSPQRAENGTVSESEKLGVAVLGRRFSDRIEHVPIKKRKFNLHSLSSPPCPPSCIEVVYHSSSRGCYPNSNGKRQHSVIDVSTEATSPCYKREISEELNGKLGYKEDFSGIEILAAAACGNSFDVDQDKENKVVEESLCEDDSEPVEETVASMEATDLSMKDLALEDKKEVSSFQDGTTTSIQNSSNDKDDKKGEESASARDDRLHWDLNVVIDAWKQPCDIENVGSQANLVVVTSVVGNGKLHMLEGCEMGKETKEIKHDETVDLSEVHGETHTPSDPRGLLHDSNRMDDQLETCFGLDCCHNECGEGAKANTQAVSIHGCIHNVASPSNTAGNIVLPDCCEKTEGCSSGLQQEEIVFVENVEVDNGDVASSGPALDRFTSEVDGSTLDEEAEESGQASSCSPQEMLSMDNCQAMAAVSLEMEPAGKAQEVGIDHPLPKCEGPISSAVVEVIPVETGDGTGLADEIVYGNVDIDSSVDVRSDKLMHISSGNFADSGETGCLYTIHEKCRGNTPSNSLEKINIESSFDETCESDFNQDDKVHIDAIEKTQEPQEAGYDSQFEDGELRESDGHFWEDNEVEGADIEQVDYGSDCDGGRLYNLEVEETESKRGGSSVVAEKIEQCSTGNAFRDHLTSPKMKTLETIERCKTKNHTVDSEDGPSTKDFTSSVVGPRALKRDLLSRIQGPLSTDASDSVERNRFDDFDDLRPRLLRGAGSNKFIARDRYATSDMHCRSAGSGCNVGSHHSPIYYAPYVSAHTRPRSVTGSRGFVMTSDHAISDAEAVEAFDSRVRRQYLSTSSGDFYRPLNQRYAAYRDDFYATYLVRDDDNPDRSRFRKYPQGVSRSIREEFRRPMPNNSSEYTDHIPYRMSRRERSISPPSREKLHYAQPYRKSRSRSRSRSLSAWLLLRERNEGSRRSSRSPDFRSARTDRVRLHFQKRYASDYDEDFVSPPRNRLSPQRNSRFNDRISGSDNFRDTKSPSMRMFRQSQRFDSVCYIKPMVHPRRLADICSGVREYKYRGSGEDNRRKQGNRYEAMPRVRRYNTDGVMRR